MKDNEYCVGFTNTKGQFVRVTHTIYSADLINAAIERARTSGMRNPVKLLRLSRDTWTLAR